MPESLPVSPVSGLSVPLLSESPVDGGFSVLPESLPVSGFSASVPVPVLPESLPSVLLSVPSDGFTSSIPLNDLINIFTIFC